MLSLRVTITLNASPLNSHYPNTHQISINSYSNNQNPNTNIFFFSSMASSDKQPAIMPTGDGSVPPGKDMTMKQSIVDKGAQMMQTLKPIKQMKLHACTFASYSHDMNRQIETHHFITRINQDFLQSAVYDSDNASAHLIGVEYIISYRLFETLPSDEQKLWHSHAYEITSGIWVNPGMPEMMQKSELGELANTYGKFWCTWQVDRGDRLPLGAPALMMSPQAEMMGKVRPELVQKRDNKYKLSSDDLIKSRLDIGIPESINPNADNWQHNGKGYAIDIHQTEMKLRTLYP